MRRNSIHEWVYIVRGTPLHWRTHSLCIAACSQGGNPLGKYLGIHLLCALTCLNPIPPDCPIFAWVLPQKSCVLLLAGSTYFGLSHPGSKHMPCPEPIPGIDSVKKGSHQVTLHITTRYIASIIYYVQTDTVTSQFLREGCIPGAALWPESRQVREQKSKKPCPSGIALFLRLHPAVLHF